MNVTELEKAREERKPICEFCGKEKHKGDYSCPRITSVTFDAENGDITIRFRPINVPSN